VALIVERFIPDEYRPSYTAVTGQLLEEIDACLAEAGPVRYLRTHGDCHAGNILWRDGAPHFVDFDDARMAPAVQDLWMMLSGDRQRQTAQLDALLEGYGEFYDFQPRELRLVEALRALRMLHYSAWLASRWEDPMFPRTFPWFNTVRYWGEQILQLREQLGVDVTELPEEHDRVVGGRQRGRGDRVRGRQHVRQPGGLRAARRRRGRDVRQFHRRNRP
jgi:Ser/Thr protein kinase RdoA (MazF antagonist)